MLGMCPSCFHSPLLYCHSILQDMKLQRGTLQRYVSPCQAAVRSMLHTDLMRMMSHVISLDVMLSVAAILSGKEQR